MYYPLYNWIGEHEITTLKKIFASNPQKKDTKKSTETCACVNAIYFAPVVISTYRLKNNMRSTRGLSLELKVALVERVRNC